MSTSFYRSILCCAVLCCGVLHSSAQLYDSLMWTPNAPVHAIVKSGNNIYLGGEFDYLGKPTGFAVPLDTVTALPFLNPFPKIDGPVYTIASDCHGGWYIGGDFHHVGGVPRRNFARIHSNGTLYPINLNPDGPVYVIEVNPYQYGEPWVFIGGDFHDIGGVQVNNIAQLKTWQQVIYSNWTPNVNGPVYAIEMVGSRIYAGGNFTAVNSNIYQNLAEITAGGTVIYSQHQPNGPVYALYYNAASKSIFLGGAFTYVGPLVRSHIAQINTVYDTVTAWNPVVFGNVRAIAGEIPPLPGSGIPEEGGGRYADQTASTPTNTIYIGGEFTYVNGNPQKYLAELSVTSPTVLPASTAFNCNGPVWTIYASKKKNKVYVGGEFTSLGGATCKNLTCIDTMGASTGWQVSVGKKVRALSLTNGLLYMGSESPCMYGYDHGHVASIDAGTGIANNWDPRVHGNVNAFALSPGNILYIGGSFDSIQGQTRANLGAIDLNTGNASSFAPTCNGTVRTLALEGNKLYTGGYFTKLNGQTRNDLGCVNVNSQSVTNWNPNANGTVNSILVNNGMLYCGGYFSVIGGANQPRLACLDTVGGFAIASFSPDLNDGVYSIAMGLNNHLVAGGWFATVNSQTRNNLCEVDLTAGALNGTNPSPDGYVRGVGTSGNYAFVGGDFNNFGGQLRPGFAAYDMTNGAVQPLSLYFDAAPLTFLKDGNYLYTGGNFVDVNVDVHAYFIRLNTTFLLGEDELSASGNALQVYPNPGTGLYSVKGDLGEDPLISVYDALGNKVAEQKERGHYELHTIDISGLPSGIYILRSGTVSARIIKTN